MQPPSSLICHPMYSTKLLYYNLSISLQFQTRPSYVQKLQMRADGPRNVVRVTFGGTQTVSERQAVCALSL